MAADAATPDTKVKVASYNVWSQGGRTAEGVDAKYNWSKAGPAVIECIRSNDADIVALQEVNSSSSGLHSGLNSYAWVIYTKEGAKTNLIGDLDSQSPVILYKSSLFSLQGSGWIDLGEDDTKPYWAVYAQLRHHTSGKDLWVFSTHLNNEQDSALQTSQVGTLLSNAESLVPEGTASLIMGDLNVFPIDNDGNVIVNYATLTGSRWEDAYDTVSAREGNYVAKGLASGTMHNTSTGGLSSVRTDHIMASDATILSYGVDRSKYENTDGTAIWPSDHFLIYSSISM